MATERKPLSQIAQAEAVREAEETEDAATIALLLLEMELV